MPDCLISVISVESFGSEAVELRHARLPVVVSGLTGATMISVGEAHACALLTDGTVQCWGSNVESQLGRSAFAMLTTPVAITGLSGVTSLDAGGYHTCALLTGGALRCWGNGVEGELGDGSTAASIYPVTPVGLNSGVTAFSAGLTHSCAVLADGSAQCWGDGSSGRLGNGLMTSSTTPVNVAGW